MGMQAHITSESLEASNVSAWGFDRAIHRIGLKPLVQGARQHVAEMPTDMVAAFAQLSYNPSVKSDTYVPAAKLGPRKRKQAEAKEEADIKSAATSNKLVIKKSIQPAKRDAPQGKSAKSERNAANKAAKRLRREKTKAKTVAKADAQAEVPHIPEVKVTKAAPAKAKAIAPVAKVKKAKAVKAVVTPKVEKPVEKATPVVVEPPKVQRENVSDQPMITKTLASGKVVSKVDNSGAAMTTVSNRGASQGEVQYVSNTVSTGKHAEYDHYENFLGMKTRYETRQVEQAYIDWLESRPNNHTYTVRGHQYKLIRIESRTQVEIAGLTVLLNSKTVKEIKVPIDYDHSVAFKKTHISERSRGRTNNVVSIDSKREQGVDTGTVKAPVIPSSSKVRILASIMTRRVAARRAAMSAFRLQCITREAVKAVRLTASKKWLRAKFIGSGQITMTYPLIFCTDDTLYEAYRLEQEPGCGDSIKVKADDPPPWEEDPPPQGAPAGSVSIDEQIRRLEIMEVIAEERPADEPVSYHMWCANKASEQEQ
ncbi:MAG: hypothetical protein V3S69_04760, partial [Dehalococcoidales bacterium]